ncbi:NAD kinase [Filobacillus milosensis]|uniref:NAD kinase n=1 Tax=Filobacillus milosensis TaxID=94137 RepID=A0A4Y8IFF3_9BACI|nr:NAD kinase [Filobacillus milosensis]TFB18496.1 NAD kinase [Filobacillus milosensis]
MIRSFQIIERPDTTSREIGEKFKKRLLEEGIQLNNSPDLVVSIGGDGTMLKGFKEFYTESTSFVGLHTGTLGFYADWQADEADLLLEKIMNEDPILDRCPLIKGEFELESGERKSFLALNEIVIKSKSISTMVLEVEINNDHFESFKGDGIIISTPSGSTAYNHSLWGSIIHPTIEAMQVTEIASINNSVYRTLNRPLILPKEQPLTLHIPKTNKEILLGIDGTEYNLGIIKRIGIKVAEEKISFARYRPFPFWKRVKEKFLIETDIHK